MKNRKIATGLTGYERLAIIQSFGKVKCGTCLREIPTPKDWNCEKKHPWITKNGCIWCDAEYHRGKK